MNWMSLLHAHSYSRSFLASPTLQLQAITRNRSIANLHSHPIGTSSPRSVLLFQGDREARGQTQTRLCFSQIFNLNNPPTTIVVPEQANPSRPTTLLVLYSESMRRELLTGHREALLYVHLSFKAPSSPCNLGSSNSQLLL